MFLFTGSCSWSLFKKTVVVLLGVSLVIGTALDAIIFQLYMPHVTAFIGRSFKSFPQCKESKHINDPNNYMTMYRAEVKKRIYELPEDHAFRSPYIIVPKIYGDNSTRKLSDTTRKVKVISCFKCPKWFFETPIHCFNRDFEACPYSECVFDHGARRTTADVLLVFVGQVGKEKMPPRPPGQIWVKTYWESPAHYSYPSPYEPWKDAFNWTLNYRTDSDIFAPINHLAWRNSDELLPDKVYLEIAKNKTKSAAWFVSHCPTPAKREVYVKEMQKYIDVDVYGKCGSLSCERSDLDVCETMLTTTYKFYLSFENSLCKDYVTEKFFRNFQYRSHIIPVARGGFDYNKYIPNEVFVNTANFSSAKDLALYLKRLGDDHEAYARMLKEKDRLTTTNYKFDWCDFCERVHTNTETKVIPDIKEWSHKEACHSPTDIGY